MNFNQAIESALATVVRTFDGASEEVLLVRDLYGKLRVMLSADALGSSGELAEKLAALLGPYTHDVGSICLDLREFQGIEQQAHQTLHDEGGLRVRLLDRLLLGTQWNATPATEQERPKRFTLFSMKGGVGRSTTTAVLAWHLAGKGKKVLVLDLDLESPGVGSTLLPEGYLPDFGIVDWFVEDALGQASTVEDDLVAVSPLSDGVSGHIVVAPAFGKETGDYLPKLGRCYLERGPSGPEAWPQRLERLVQQLEDKERPDVVLLDSRSGLHDTSAALVLAMGAETLLFAVNSRQTWTAYGFLFEHWRFHPSIRHLREKLWIVASMIPETDSEKYLRGFREGASDLFSKLYDRDADAEDAFFFAVEDEAAPHAPHQIQWNRGLQSFNPTSVLSVVTIELAYRAFLEWFDAILLSDEEGS